jgi:hypothetical protein
MMPFRSTTVIALLCLAAPYAHAAPKTVTVQSTLPPSAVFEVVNANVIRCFADGEFVLTPYAGSTIQPPKVVINGRWGHQFSVIDMLPATQGTDINVKLVYALGRGRRGDDWKQALGEWVNSDTHTFCPRLP